jgi:hypothetical protein
MKQKRRKQHPLWLDLACSRHTSSHEEATSIAEYIGQTYVLTVTASSSAVEPIVCSRRRARSVLFAMFDGGLEANILVVGVQVKKT